MKDDREKEIGYVTVTQCQRDSRKPVKPGGNPGTPNVNTFQSQDRWDKNKTRGDVYFSDVSGRPPLLSPFY